MHLALALALFSSVTSQPDSVATGIEALVRPHAEAELLSGVILVARGDEIVFERGYGFANWELRVPNTPSHRFGIGSVTKPMTMILAERLRSEGRVSLDARVETFLPGFPRGPDGGAATIDHLLNHRSGVPHRVTDAVDETQPLYARDIVDRVRAEGLLFEPGSQRLYSSAGYTCLARVIETVEGAAFEELLADGVFSPAGMESAASETGQALMPMRASPYRLGAAEREIVVASAPYKDFRFLTGAGSVYATAGDMLRFVNAVREGVFGDEVRARILDGDRAAWQGIYGRTNGYEASVDVLIDDALVFVFLSNLQSASNWQIRAQIQNLLAGRETSAVPLPPPVVAPFEPPESIVGTYGNGPAEIALFDGKLFRGDNEFYPVEGGRYYVPGSGSLMRFRRDANGAVDALVTISGNGEESVLPRLATRDALTR